MRSIQLEDEVVFTDIPYPRLFSDSSSYRRFLHYYNKSRGYLQAKVLNIHGSGTIITFAIRAKLDNNTSRLINIRKDEIPEFIDLITL
jgi:hypothetical protein